ncbi:MAG: adenine phosphoribosyltransferase [Sphingomonadaceae bacterium]
MKTAEDYEDNSDLAALIRTIPDYPKPGVLFRDISTLLLDGEAFRKTVDRIADRVAGRPIDLVAGIEARGFLVAAALAYKIGAGTLLLRKRDKLPGICVGIDYSLEYGMDRLEIHADACTPGARVLLVDDLLATGGTALAGAALLRSVGAELVGAAFIVDLPDLEGARRLRADGLQVDALIEFPGH